MEKGREKLLLGKQGGCASERAAAREGRKSPAVPGGSTGPLECSGHWSVQGHWRMQSQPFPGSWTGRQQPEPQTWRSNPFWHSSATLGIHTHEASPCKPLAPPSQLAALLASQEGFPSWLQVSTSRHRTQSVSVDIPPSQQRFAAPVNALSILL